MERHKKNLILRQIPRQYVVFSPARRGRRCFGSFRRTAELACRRQSRL